MTLEELQELSDKKLKINDTELDIEALKTPQLHNEFLKHYNKFNLLLTKTESELRIIKLHKWEYYTGKADPAVYQTKPFNLKILKQDVDKYIEADEDYIKIKQKVDYLKTICDFLDKTIKQISNRGFLIKDAIEWRKFTSGAI